MRLRALAAVSVLALSACTSSGALPDDLRTRSAPATPLSSSQLANAPQSANSDWPSYHGDAAHDGVSESMPGATGTPTVVASLKLDGAVYASPIVVGGVVIVATEHDSVYAYTPAGTRLWHVSLGTPSPAAQRPCGDIDPLGITSTPIYDASTKLVYVVAELGGTPVRHVLYALSPTDGAVRWQVSVDLPGVDPDAMQQRGALAISGGRVWVSFGALAGDCGDYKGRLVGVKLDGTGTPLSYDPSTRRQGGIWNAAGPTVDASGALLVVSANGSSFPGDAYDHTNSVDEVNPADATLMDSFAPSDWAQNNKGDVGLGSQGVALVGTKWAVLGGKSGPVYVLAQGHLGGIGGQVDEKDICKSFGGAAVDSNVVYLPCTDGVRAVQVDLSSGKLSVLWHAGSTIDGSPVIGGGRVWALDQNAGTLYALNPTDGTPLAHVSVGVTSRFATPALFSRYVLVPTMTGLTIVKTS